MNCYNTIMKKISLIIIVTLMFTALAAAQGQGMGQTDSEKLTAYKIAFFTQRLNLTPAEAEKFWPLYNDYSARKNKMQLDRLSLMRYAMQNEANMSDSELSSTADKLAQSFTDEANLSGIIQQGDQEGAASGQGDQVVPDREPVQAAAAQGAEPEKAGPARSGKGRPEQFESQEF